MVLHLLGDITVLPYPLPLTVWSTAFKHLLSPLTCGTRLGIDMEQRKSVYKLLYFCLQIPLLFLQSSWFALWAVLSGNIVFLSLPSDRFIWNLFHLSMDGIFTWVFLPTLTFLPNPLCLYQLVPFKIGKDLIHCWFFLFKSTVFCLYLSVMLESVGIHGVCVLRQPP